MGEGRIEIPMETPTILFQVKIGLKPKLFQFHRFSSWLNIGLKERSSPSKKIQVKDLILHGGVGGNNITCRSHLHGHGVSGTWRVSNSMAVVYVAVDMKIREYAKMLVMYGYSVFLRKIS